jgi:arylsulfatase A-like enzyme
MHVSDWFPTLLSFAEIPSSSYTLPSPIDGIDHAATILRTSHSPPRDTLLYNALYNVTIREFNISTNAPFAIRNNRYKLIHEFTGNTISEWMDFSSVDDDVNSEITSCTPGMSLTGRYTKMLFDLKLDPYEMNNLYTNEEYADTVVSNDQ